ncbi:MAG: radical SAM protein, partial [Bdellovibrionales bacterium]
MRILLVTPPMTQINSPYPATPYLKAFLSAEGHEVKQIDLGLDLVLKLMTREGLARLKSALVKGDHNSDSVGFFLEAYQDYADTIEPIIHFLQGKDSSLALRIARRKLVPEGPRFQSLNEHDSILLSKFGEMGLQDQAKYIA